MLELTPHFQSNSKEPLYQQLYLHIRKEIEAGRITAYSRLPSIRSLTRSLDLSKTTIEAAYQQLLTEGYIDGKARVGYYVMPFEEYFFQDKSKKISKVIQEKSQDEPLIEFDYNPSQIDRMCFPYVTWRKLTNDCMNEQSPELLLYGEGQGEWGLRCQIASYLRQSRGVNCIPEQIVIGSGIQYSIHLLMQLLSSVNAVAMEEPGYFRVRSVFQMGGLPVRPIPLEHDGLNINLLYQSDANVVYVTPSHQFPIGMVMPYAKRMQLLQWANERKGFIIEDDYDSEFRYSGKPIPSLQGLDQNENVIYIGTFSKSFFPGFRMNYMVLPHRLLNCFSEHIAEMDSPVSKIHQAAMQHFMEREYWQKHIRRMRKVYQKKHDHLLCSIRSEMGHRVSIIGQNAGLHILLDIQSEKSIEELERCAKLAGVRIYTLAKSWITKKEEQSRWVFMGFGDLRMEEIAEGVKRLRACWFDS